MFPPNDKNGGLQPTCKRCKRINIKSSEHPERVGSHEILGLVLQVISKS